MCNSVYRVHHHHHHHIITLAISDVFNFSVTSLVVSQHRSCVVLSPHLLFEFLDCDWVYIVCVCDRLAVLISLVLGQSIFWGCVPPIGGNGPPLDVRSGVVLSLDEVVDHTQASWAQRRLFCDCVHGGTQVVDSLCMKSLTLN